MIRLKCCPRPHQLTTQRQKELTEEFITKNKSVWKKTYIKKALLQMSHSKCCYCECKLGEESKYIEIEHFFPKSKYPQKVLEWENLLPACGRCNRVKKDHDPAAEPIIHPVNDDPKKHLGFKLYQIRHLNNSTIGKNTVEVLDLNNMEKLIRVRLDIGNKLLEGLKKLNDDADDYFQREPLTTRHRNRLYRTLKKLMECCLPSSQYSAVTATVLLNEGCYWELKQKFKDNKLWDNDLEELERRVRECALVYL